MSIKFEWVQINSGVSSIGISEEQATKLNIGYNTKIFSRETPQQTVFTSAFSISKYPVTNQQFKIFSDETDYHATAWKFGCIANSLNTYVEHKMNHPVRFLNLYDALAFCNWANCRLPTIIEWERAASGQSSFVYPWGNDWDATRCNNAEYTNLDENHKVDTTPVNQYERWASPDGVTDMAGNVWELTSSTIVTNLSTDLPEIRDLSFQNTPDHIETVYREYPILKGGSAHSNFLGIRNSLRFTKHLPNSLGDFIGFRVVKLN